MRTRGWGRGRERRPGTGAGRLRREGPWLYSRGRRRSGWLAVLLSRLRRRWRSFWHWEVLHAIRERYPGLARTRAPASGELRRFPQRTWH